MKERCSQGGASKSRRAILSTWTGSPVMLKFWVVSEGRATKEKVVGLWSPPPATEMLDREKGCVYWEIVNPIMVGDNSVAR